MEIPKTYDPKGTEEKWYSYWMEKGYFRSLPDDRPREDRYTIVIPPPNVTGVLHMGHMLNNTIQDVLIRRARMLGKNACWVPGTDHASIATEAKVVALLKEKGIKKEDLSREEFLKYAWEWKEKYGGIILEQLKKLGASCDWERTKFTMDPDLSEAVTDVFIDLYNKGFIYRGTRMVNWDPVGLTAVSDEEVNYKEVNSRLFYVKYPIEGSTNEFITIATTRPETILGDTAVCVHPDDDRYKHLKGKKAIIPLVNRAVPIIFDEYIDREFGTGALKVTPAHDINDYNLGIKHKLEIIDTIAPNGTMSEAAGFFVGEDRFAVRKKMGKELENLGLLVKIEDIKNKVGYSERTDAVIEPKLSLQWFLKMKEFSLPAYEAVMKGEVKLIPDKFINTYRHWMENVKDWCISRQLWWGQQIPAWYDKKGNVAVTKTRKEAEKILGTKEIKQDEDVVDTWFSSWLWPISVFDPKVFAGGKDYKGNADINYYYPTNDLVTAPEILFFWVARMIMAGYEYRGEKPFTHVYLTGIVRDKQGRKMSKSLGNSPDPIDLMDKFSTDGVRMGMLLCSPAGNDLLFDESYCEQGRNFANKIWNAFRLIKSWETDEKLNQPATSVIAVDRMGLQLGKILAQVDKAYDSYRLSDSLMLTYKLFWDDFCGDFLEDLKPEFIEGKAGRMDPKTYKACLDIFEALLKMIHPIMPFISEEIWHLLRDRKENDCLIVASWPGSKTWDASDVFSSRKVSYKGIDSDYLKVLQDYEKVNGGIAFVQKSRQGMGLSPKVKLEVIALGKNADLVSLSEYAGRISRRANCDFSFGSEFEKDRSGFIMFTGGDISWFVKKEGKESGGDEEELKKELAYQKGFLQAVEKKLANEKFVANAKPELVAMERKKKADAEARIRAIEEQLKGGV